MAEIKINDIEYKVELLNARDAHELLMDIIGLVGRSAYRLPVLLQGAIKEGEDQGKLLADAERLGALAGVIRQNKEGATTRLFERI